MDVTEFSPSARAWICALLWITLGAALSPLFLFRAYSMPISPLFVPVLIYPLCQQGPSNPEVTSRIGQLFQKFKPKLFTREEMVWIASMVAAGGATAPAYEWIATIDLDYGRPLGRWQQLVVVLGTQLFGWSLGQILKPVFVGRHPEISWPDTLPLSYLIQTLYPSMDNDTPNPSRSSSMQFTTNKSIDSPSQMEKQIVEVNTQDTNETLHNSTTTVTSISSIAARKRYLALLTMCTLCYQVVVCFVSPILKSLCLLCLWAPQSKVLSQLGSGFNGVGILSLTFDWAALSALHPLVTPLWALLHFYAGAVIMLYVLTPLGWRLNWWGSANLPIVSTSVFDVSGDIYNVTLVRQAVVTGAQVPNMNNATITAMTYYNAYSPVRMSVNSALGYIFSVAAIAAVVIHLLLWQSQWVSKAIRDVALSLLRLWDLRPLFRIKSDSRTPHDNNSVATFNNNLGVAEHKTRLAVVTVSWDRGYIFGRVVRVLIFTLSIGVALMSAQLGISTLPGWQVLVAVVWATVMSVPIGFVEAISGFTLPMGLLPHILAGWMQGPGSPIETSYFHLWATAPIRIALGWSGVRSLQLVHHCCTSHPSQRAEHMVRDDRYKQHQKYAARTFSLPWIKRGLLFSVMWGACINHLSYVAFSNSQGLSHELPVQILPFPKGDIDGHSILAPRPLDTKISNKRLLGWQEEGEFGRLPAALSSELVVWGIVGPRSVFAQDSPYRLLFAYGSLIGILLPLLLFMLHKLLLRLAKAMSATDGASRTNFKYWPDVPEALVRAANVAKGIQIPLVLAGMVAVPAIPANFVISGIIVAVGGQIWCRYRGRSLVDRSLYSAAMDTGTRLAVVGLFVVGQILKSRQGRLEFVQWWGNQPGNVERCISWTK